MPLLATERPHLRLTADLARVCAASHAAPLRLSDVLSAADDRGFALVLLLATFPFVVPFPTLGLSTPVGFALALAALGLVLGRPASTARPGRPRRDPRRMRGRSRELHDGAGTRLADVQLRGQVIRR